MIKCGQKSLAILKERRRKLHTKNIVFNILGFIFEIFSASHLLVFTAVKEPWKRNVFTLCRSINYITNLLMYQTTGILIGATVQTMCSESWHFSPPCLLMPFKSNELRRTHMHAHMYINTLQNSIWRTENEMYSHHPSFTSFEPQDIMGFQGQMRIIFLLLVTSQYLLTFSHLHRKLTLDKVSFHFLSW